MAFYSASFDESGKEIETTRQTYRKAINDCSDENMILSNRSSRFKTVRYVNSATLIEKGNSPVNKASKSEDSRDSQVEGNASEVFDFSIDKGRDTFSALELRSGDSFPSSNNLSYSYRKTCDEATTIAPFAIDKGSDTFPALELRSGDSFPSNNTNLSYSYRKICDEASKLIQKPDAFREWLDAKKSAKTMQIMKRKYELQRIIDEKEQRENEAKAKYNEWLSNKMKAKVENKRKQLQSKQNNLVSDESSFIDSRGKERNYQAWLEKKLRQEKAQKERLRTEILQQKKYENLKKQKASAIFENWLKKAPLKPKPVPLNRGIYSLKGSLSKMYVNPNPWVSIDENHGNSSN